MENKGAARRRWKWKNCVLDEVLIFSVLAKNLNTSL
jgi:hypothetical protein